MLSSMWQKLHAYTRRISWHQGRKTITDMYARAHTHTHIYTTHHLAGLFSKTHSFTHSCQKSTSSRVHCLCFLGEQPLSPWSCAETFESFFPEIIHWHKLWVCPQLFEVVGFHNPLLVVVFLKFILLKCEGKNLKFNATPVWGKRSQPYCECYGIVKRKCNVCQVT